MDEDLKHLLEANAAETRAALERLERNDAETRVAIGRLEVSVVDLRRHFDVTAERLESKIQLVAEGFVQVDEKVDREIANVREEMRQGDIEISAIVKLSNAKMDRRVRKLESGGG